jgi:hypothetical protein
MLSNIRKSSPFFETSQVPAACPSYTKINISMEYWWSVTDKRKSMYSEKNLSWNNGVFKIPECPPTDRLSHDTDKENFHL